MYLPKKTTSFLFSLLSMLCVIQLNAQDIQANKASLPQEWNLSEHLDHFELFSMDAALIKEQMLSRNGNFSLQLGRHNWDFELYQDDIYSEKAVIRVLGEQGESIYPVPRDIIYKGTIVDAPQKWVVLIIHDDYIYGHISEGSQRTYIASLSKYHATAPSDLYVVFDREDQVIPTNHISCGLDSYPEFDLSDHHHSDSERTVTGNCYDVDLGIASDYLMYQDKGSIQAVINHVVSVMTDVETDYETSDFDDALEFEIVEQVISMCESCDPWTNSTNSSTFLSDFNGWIGDGGFNNSIDMGQLWTDRDFDGTTVGLAYRASGLLCSAAHHVLEDFTSNADFLRVLTSHEIGHNLNASHDASGSSDIMAPSVSASTTWSAASVSSIDIEIDDGFTDGCLVACAATPCDPVTDVSITSITATGFDISWTATTEGNYRLRVRDEETFSIIHTTSLSSSATMTINPTGWEICHKYMVIVENDCGSSVYSAPVSTIVSDIDQGCAEFSADDFLDWNSLTVNFTDESINATSWNWDFGDGNTSTSQNPSHTYSTPGTYEVSLSVNSSAHTETKSNYIFVLDTDQALPYTAADGGNMDDNDFGTESSTANKTSLFEKGIPSNYFTNTTNCWVTDLDGNMVNDENEMALYSPGFNFNGVTSATLSFDLGMQYQFSNAPFAIQVHYSTDGTSWTRLGSDADASWYNRGPSSGGAGTIESTVFSDLMGWTYSHQGFPWSYDVTSLAGNDNVYFRFLFSLDSGWSGGYERAGVMIDNFEIAAITLPIELTSFEGSKSDKNIMLNWETATEVNNDYFVIEKSNDGRQFEEIATIQGAGNSYFSQQYELMDQNPFIGSNYYRLKQVDYDGSVNIHDQLVVIDYFEKGNLMIQPNPVTNSVFELIYESEKTKTLALELFNATGLQLDTRIINIEAGTNSIPYQYLDLPKGVYYIRSSNGLDFDIVKFIKQ